MRDDRGSSLVWEFKFHFNPVMTHFAITNQEPCVFRQLFVGCSWVANNAPATVLGGCSQGSHLDRHRHSFACHSKTHWCLQDILYNYLDKRVDRRFADETQQQVALTETGGVGGGGSGGGGGAGGGVPGSSFMPFLAFS